jgi:vanillate O-demethylase ferredoxin subunit
MNLLTVSVLRRQGEALGVASFELVAPDGGPLPAFTAGAHIDVHVPGGKVRQYSLCNDPAERDRYIIAVLDVPDSRGGSRAMHELVHAGATLTISAPKNHFELAPHARRSLLLAGGIGVTPILCMAESLQRAGADFALHYCSRSPARTAFRRRILQSPFADRAQFHFDDGADDQKLDLAALLKHPEPGTHLYVCGPRGFMDAVLATARARGWPGAQLHYEFFAADVGPRDSDGSFEVRLARSARSLRVARDQTVVEAVAAAGVAIPTSCEQGVCGTCLTRVLDGQPDHRDMYLTDEEQQRNDCFLPCCSRAKSATLVLDL